MVNYMICVDEGENTEHAIKEIITHMFQNNKDTLYLISIAEEPISFPTSGMSIAIVAESLKAIERQHKQILVNRANFCKNLGVNNVKALLGHGNHVGEAVVKAAVEKNIHTIVVGRRGMGPIKRVLIGSTSRYILEHAKCNVLCIKEISEQNVKSPTLNNNESSQVENEEESKEQYDLEHLHLHV